MPVTQEQLDSTFAVLEAAAIANERCPQSQPHGPLVSAHTGLLARAGRIKVAIYFHNWRVVTIMEGPHAGKTTQACPKHGAKPYKMVYKDHVLVRRQ